MDEEGNLIDSNNPVLIRSICKIDHFNMDETQEKHSLLDRKIFDPEKTLERLVRTN